MQCRFYEIPHFRSAGRSCWKLILLYDNKFSLFLITRVPGPRPCGHDGRHERRLETLLESMSMLTLYERTHRKPRRVPGSCGDAFVGGGEVRAFCWLSWSHALTGISLAVA